MRARLERAVQTSLTRLFDTAMATRSRYPAVSWVSPWVPQYLPWIFGRKSGRSGSWRSVLSIRRPGQDKNPLGRSQAGVRPKRGTGVWGFSGVSGRFQLEEFELRVARQETG